jgi:Ni2+-binding GTPase involved in maturation of urease and hydrogenase
MPRKKKEDDIPTPSNKIINFYEHIPKDMLNKNENPNYHLHQINLPFRMVVCAPSGSGKTNFLINLLHLFSQGNKGTFFSVTIVTANADEPLYKWLSLQCPQIQIKEGLQNTPLLDKMDKSLNHLVIWDDCVLAKDLSMVEKYYMRARKQNCSCIFISQSYFKTPIFIRKNCNYMVILRLSGNREINLILSEFGLGLTKEQLLEMYKYATKEKFSALVIDMEDMDKRFRKGFLEILDPDDVVFNKL